MPMNTESQGRPLVVRTNVRLMSLKDAGTYMSLHYFTLRDMCLRGELPFLRCGRKYLLDVRDLDAWIDKGKKDAAA